MLTNKQQRDVQSEYEFHYERFLENKAKADKLKDEIIPLREASNFHKMMADNLKWILENKDKVGPNK